VKRIEQILSESLESYWFYRWQQQKKRADTGAF
jgi:hypothetical protein